LPTLEQSFLELSSPSIEAAKSSQPEIEAAEAQSLIDTARSRLVERIQGTIDRLHQDASRAADAEIEEYRQMQQQRIEELEKERSSLSTRIDELSERISSSDEKERVEALKKRKERKAEHKEIDAELTDLRRRREQGYPEEQREIRDRHALDVQVTPLTVTDVEYERGEIDLELTAEGITRTVTVGYGSGVGITDEIHCSVCGERLTEQRPLASLTDGLRCGICSN
jgi:chromosome segregation ATPase